VNWGGVAVWGFAATVILTTIMAGSQELGLTRMSLPFVLGTMFTSDRDRAKLLGLVAHLINGWWIALIYAALFEARGEATWWFGALTGLAHGLFVLLVVMPVLPGLHPRMASEQWGPTPTKLLEPPGFLALNYGRRTPFATLIAHIIYGGLLGTFYQMN
jgi:uncharacterized membrane protein YagU involved in acid resistance